MFVAAGWEVVGSRLENGKKWRTESGGCCHDEDVRILVVEDDRRLAELLARRLRSEGHHAETCGDGPAGLERAASGEVDMAIVDWMLPGLDGSTLTRTLRDRGIPLPILMLTARDSVEDRVAGLRSGADDYLVKPFAFDELIARIEALSRRASNRRSGDSLLHHGPISLDARARRVTVDGREVDLTNKEFELLRCLLQHRGRVLTRTQLKELVWDFSFDAKTKVVDLYVHYLRRKLGRAGELIETVRGVGYVLGR